MKCRLVRAVAAISVFFSLGNVSLVAQDVQLGVNVAELAAGGTLNAEAGVSLGRHWTLGMKTKYNPWSFGQGENLRQDRQRTFWMGTRFWPWYVYSGWWGSLGLQYREYNTGGYRSPLTQEGDSYGATLSAGYSWMIHKNVNLELGLGFWGGYRDYTVYACPSCGDILSKGNTVFILPNEAVLSLMYVF